MRLANASQDGGDGREIGRDVERDVEREERKSEEDFKKTDE